MSSLTIFLVVSGVAVVSNAYPPGRKLIIVTNKDMVSSACSKVSVSIANARPGKITLSVGKNAPTSIQQKGFVTKNIKMCKCGTFLLKAVSPVSETVRNEIATTQIFVPCVSVSKSGKIDQKLIIKVSNVKPGTLVTVIPKCSKQKRCIVLAKVKKGQTNVSLVIPAFTFVKGAKNSYVVTIGPSIQYSYTFTGR